MLVRAKESFWLPNKQLVSGGILLDSEHPIVKRHANLFEPVEQSAGFDVESATAAPGERRSTVARGRGRRAKTVEPEPDAGEDDEG